MSVSDNAFGLSISFVSHSNSSLRPFFSSCLLLFLKFSATMVVGNISLSISCVSLSSFLVSSCLLFLKFSATMVGNIYLSISCFSLSSSLFSS